MNLFSTIVWHGALIHVVTNTACLKLRLSLNPSDRILCSLYLIPEKRTADTVILIPVLSKNREPGGTVGHRHMF